ncbi:hypothetical protein [Methanoplanus endosymbiosus]|uniref:Uncharacterized protein n=1 Tax=Methanoplanus endosymbiosus TaxID=33865 RepID=A0A9E7PKV5_9EURY|nr:hypothetical protein [Methanoplanus endosymbiosus]UUX91968.1 hypothetical protein L6E24_11460 [Methanoplanus endosymbiosus]
MIIKRRLPVFVSACLLFAVISMPVSGDIITPTKTEVFFEKDGLPYNDSVEFTVRCYGYTFYPGSEEFTDYINGNYEKKEPGTYNMTEVFSYSATAGHYGDVIYEPFYLNYRVIDHCTLCGETSGKKFVIDDIGDSPIPDCKRAEYRVIRDYDSDVCRMETDSADACFEEEDRLRCEKADLCGKYLEIYDENGIYPDDTRTMEADGVTMVLTKEYLRCTDEAYSLDLNCTDLLKTVPCEDYCDPEGHPVDRVCSLHYTIPTDENGNIIETGTKQESGISDTITENTAVLPDVRNETADNKTSSLNSGKGADNNLFTAIMKFLGLIK